MPNESEHCQIASLLQICAQETGAIHPDSWQAKSILEDAWFNPYKNVSGSIESAEIELCIAS